MNDAPLYGAHTLAIQVAAEIAHGSAYGSRQYFWAYDEAERLLGNRDLACDAVNHEVERLGLAEREESLKREIERFQIAEQTLRLRLSLPAVDFDGLPP